MNQHCWFMLLHMGADRKCKSENYERINWSTLILIQLFLDCLALGWQSETSPDFGLAKSLPALAGKAGVLATDGPRVTEICGAHDFRCVIHVCLDKSIHHPQFAVSFACGWFTLTHACLRNPLTCMTHCHFFGCLLGPFTSNCHNLQNCTSTSNLNV